MVMKWVTDSLKVMVCTGVWGCVEKGRTLKGNTPSVRRLSYSEAQKVLLEVQVTE